MKVIRRVPLLCKFLMIIYTTISGNRGQIITTINNDHEVEEFGR